MENSYSDSEEAAIYSDLTNNDDSEIGSFNKSKLSNEKNEPLLTETQRYTLHPIKYPAIWNMYNKQKSCFWITSEVDLSKDKADWLKLSENERYFIKHILAFFAGSDGIVGCVVVSSAILFLL